MFQAIASLNPSQKESGFCCFHVDVSAGMGSLNMTLMLRLASTSAVGLAALLSTISIQTNESKSQPPGAKEAKLVEIQPVEWAKLDKRWKEIKDTYSALLQGTANAKDKENAEAIDVAAQYFCFRVTWPVTQDLTPPGKMDSVHTELDRDMNIAKRAKPNTNEFLKQFGEKVAKYSREVMENNKRPIARINATRVLARVAEEEIEDTVDPLIDAIKNEDELDAVKDAVSCMPSKASNLY
jgi:hypothetical protein